MRHAHVLEQDNPFEPGKVSRHTMLEHPATVREFLTDRFGVPQFEFAVPTVCLVNGKPLLRPMWAQTTIRPGDIVNFVAVPRFGAETLLYIAIAIAVISVAASVALLLTTPKPGKGLGDAVSSAYTLEGQRNQVKLNGPIESCYGLVRRWPTVAARPYNKFINNEQWLYILLCVGQGEYAISETLIEDTDIANFTDVEFEYYAPGEAVDLFPDNVVTSVEVSGIELLGPNEVGYDWSGPFVANASGTQANHLEIDLAFPNGVYFPDKKGRLLAFQIEAEFEYREIDDAGDPVGAWTSLADLDITWSTTGPQRLTLELDVAAGRYEVRGQRLTDKYPSNRVAQKLVWDGLRAFLPSTKDYGDVTLLAIKARASNNLNDNASARFNCRATRKLPIYDLDTETWSANTATRSIVWAFCDVFRAQYGARLLDTYLDLPTLVALDETYTALGHTFDHVFDQAITVWEAAAIVARVGRAVPMLNGSQVSMVRDELKTVPTAAFAPEVMLAGSFGIEHTLANTNDKTCVAMEYTDPDTWLPVVVNCLVGTDTDADPEIVRLEGCTNREQAYHEGLYIRATQLLHRTQIQFTTERDGLIPRYGDLIAVGHDVPRWGQSGFLEAIDGLTLTLSKEVVFTTGTHYIAFRKKNGDVAGPFEVVAGGSASEVTLLGAIDETVYFFDSTHEQPLFLFGPGEELWTLCRVVDMEPGENGRVAIKCIKHDAGVFAYDETAVPDEDEVATPPQIPKIPTVTGAAVALLPDEQFRAMGTWLPALGAVYYIAEFSYDNTVWTRAGIVVGTSIPLTIDGDYLYFRVAGVGSGQGPWSEWDGAVGVLSTEPGSVDTLAAVGSFTGISASVEWDPIAGTETLTYRLRIYDNADTTPVLLRTVDFETQATLYEHTYTFANFTTDGGTDRHLRFTVTAVNTIGESLTPDVVDQTNPAPAQLTAGIGSTLNTAGVDVTYDLVWTDVSGGMADFKEYKVYGSFTSGFTPGGGNLLYTGTAATFLATVTGNPHAAYYWRVTVLDDWDSDNTPSAEQTIPAYP